MSQLHTRAKCKLVLQPLFWLWKTFPKVYWILLDLLASSISNLGFVSRTWRKNLTVHTKSIFRGVATLLSIWTKYIPNLHSFSPEAQHLFTVTHKKHHLRLRKAQYYPLKTSDIDKSSPSGAKGVLDNIASQLGLKEEDFDNLLIPVAGDQLTVNNIQKLWTYTSTDCTTYSRYSWTLPWIQLWHMKWAVLRSIFHTHWSGKPGKGLCGLHTDCQTLSRKHINPGKCGFYSHTDFIFDTFEALCLGALWWVFSPTMWHYLMLMEISAVLHSEGKSTPPSQEGRSSLNIIQELDALFPAGSPQTSFAHLENLANKVYLCFMTTKAHCCSLCWGAWWGRRASCIDVINTTIYYIKISHTDMTKSHDWLAQPTTTLWVTNFVLQTFMVKLEEKWIQKLMVGRGIVGLVIGRWQTLLSAWETELCQGESWKFSGYQL